MAWAILDEYVVDGEKFLALESDCGLSPLEVLAAVGLWTKGIGWCARSRTDGFIPRAHVPKLVPAGISPAKAFRLADALVAARGRKDHGLWEAREDGYQVHDFTDHNFSLADIEARREAGRKGGRRSAERRASGQATASAPAQASGQAHAQRTLQAMTGDVPNPLNPPQAHASTNGTDPTADRLGPKRVTHNARGERVGGHCAERDRQAGRAAGECALSFQCPRYKTCAEVRRGGRERAGA